MRKILIINPFGIGDVLFTTPLISGLRKAFPKDFIGFICNRRSLPVLANNPHINKIWVFEKDEYRRYWRGSKAKFIREFFGFLARIRRERFDAAFDLSLGHQYSFCLMLLGVRQRIGYDFKDRGRFLTRRFKITAFANRHMAEYYLELLKSLNGPDNTPAGPLEFYLADREERQAEDFLRQNEIEDKGTLIGLIPGGGASWGGDSAYKHWPPEKFAEAADEILKRHNAACLVFGSKDETGVCAKVLNSMHNKAIDCCGKIELAQFAALLKRCNLVLCNDGGPLHVAAAVGTKTVSIFGPVDEKVYGPYPPQAQRHIVVKADIDCRPCYRSFRFTRCIEKKCLNNIEVSEVVNSADKLL